MPRTGILIVVLGFFLLMVMCATTMGIHDAAKRGDLDKVKYLLEEKPEWINLKNEYDLTPLHSAADGGSKEVAELLIEKGADVNAKNKYGMTALMFAAMRGHTETVRALLVAGADVNAKEEAGGKMYIAQQRGKNKNYGVFSTPGVFVSGMTALMFASGFGHEFTVEALIANGADVNAKDKGDRTALMLASKNGKYNVVEMLLTNGADVNARATGGFQITPISGIGTHDIIAGPDPGDKGKDGWTALSLAENQKHTSIIFLLKRAGAKAEVKESKKESKAVTYLKRGNAWLGKGDYDKAISDFNKAIELDPTYADAYFNRGYAYLKQRKWQKAVENFDQVLRLNPGHALAEQLRESALSFIQY